MNENESFVSRLRYGAIILIIYVIALALVILRIIR